MRMHIVLDSEVVAEIDAIAGPRRRSAFVRKAILAAIERNRRASSLRTAAGTFSGTGHDWDDDEEGWVRRQLTGELRPVG